MMLHQDHTTLSWAKPDIGFEAEFSSDGHGPTERQIFFNTRQITKIRSN